MFTLPIPNVHESVERPIIFGVVDQLQRETFLPHANRVIYEETIEGTKTPGVASCPGVAYGLCETTIRLGVQTERIIERHTRIVNDFDNIRPILHDKKRDIWIKPVHEGIRATITIEIRSASKSQLSEWVRNVNYLHKIGRGRAHHKMEYGITLHSGAYVWLQEMHSMMHDKKEIDLSQYIKNNSVNSLDIISSGNYNQLITSGYQTRSVGYIDQGYPTVEVVSDGRYIGRMEYVIEYDQPTNTVHNYPFMVDQSIVPDNYIPIPPKVPSCYFTENPMEEVPFWGTSKHLYRTLRIPNADQFQLDKFPSWYQPIFTALLSIDKDNPLEAFSLYELGCVVLSDGLLEALSDTYHPDMTTPYKTPFILTLHRNDRLLHHDYLKIDTDLNIVLTKPLEITGIYRISLCALTNTSAIKRKYFNRLIIDPELLRDYVALVNGFKYSFDTHGLNNICLENDFKIGNGAFLRHAVPLVRIEDQPDRETAINPNLYNYERVFAGDLIDLRTVMSTYTKASPLRLHNGR